MTSGETLTQLIERVGASPTPCLAFVRRAATCGQRLGVFASSFNPTTVAHCELMKRAATQYALDEILALAGAANADKVRYETTLEERIAMVELTTADETRISVAVTSHAFFVDMVEAIEPHLAAQTDLHFIIGFDTFERALDLGNHYTAKYHRHFATRVEALAFFLTHSRLIVAGRGKAGRTAVEQLIARAIPTFADRVLFLDTPDDLGERSATEVRRRVRAGLPIVGLVPPAVERYIYERGLYR